MSLTGPVDLDEEMRLTVADRLPQAPQLPSEYAPRKPIKHVETFMALPLKEIDDAMEALKARYEAACARGQTLRDLIVQARDEHLANLERERAFAQFTTEAFDVLERKYTGLDESVTVDAPRAEPPASEAEVPS